MEISELPLVYLDPSYLRSLAHQEQLSEMEKVKITAGQFEGLLIGMFLKDALKPVFKGYLNESGSAHDIYRYFLTNTLAQSIGRIGAMGFSNLLQMHIQTAENQGREKGNDTDV